MDNIMPIRGLDSQKERSNCLGLSILVTVTQLFGAGSIEFYHLLKTPPQTENFLFWSFIGALIGTIVPWIFWYDEIIKSVKTRLGYEEKSEDYLHDLIRKVRLQRAILGLIIMDTLIVFIVMLFTGGPGRSIYDPLLATIPVIALILKQPWQTIKYALYLQGFWGFLAIEYILSLTGIPDFTQSLGSLIYQSHQDTNFYIALFAVVGISAMISFLDAKYVHKLYPKSPCPSKKEVLSLNGYISENNSGLMLSNSAKLYLKKGRKVIKKAARDWGLFINWLGVSAYNASRVHELDNIFTQSVILSLPYWTHDYNYSFRTSKKITKTIAFLTFAAHWIDDLFDDIQFNWDTQDLRSEVKSIGNMEQLKNKVPILKFVVDKMKKQVPIERKVYIERAVYRIILGGLIQNADSDEHISKFISEYTRQVDLNITSDLIKVPLLDLRKKRPNIEWVTSKTVMELLHCCEDDFDSNISEAYNMLYAPILYYQDIEQEIDKENFSKSFKSKLPGESDMESDMLCMINIYENFIHSYYKENKNGVKQQVEQPHVHRARMKQLGALLHVYGDTLPCALKRKYDAIIAASKT